MSPLTDTPESPRDKGVAKIAELIGDMKLGMFTTTDKEGNLLSRPMATLEVDDDGDLWFVSGADSRKVRQVVDEERVNVTFSSGSSWVSISGTAEIVHDVEKAREIWTPGATAWFPDGPETAGMVLVKVNSTAGEYWDTATTRIASLVSLVKSRITGERPHHDDNETVTL
jgi:general stress protein 26